MLLHNLCNTVVMETDSLFQYKTLDRLSTEEDKRKTAVSLCQFGAAFIASSILREVTVVLFPYAESSH